MTSAPQEIAPEHRLLAEKLAGKWADLYVRELLFPALTSAGGAPVSNFKEATDVLDDHYASLALFFQNYAFSRRGKERVELASSACDALDLLADERGIEQVLLATDGKALWDRFCAICDERRIKNSEQLNLGPIAGVLELAQELYQAKPAHSISSWIHASINQSGRVEDPFLRLVDVRGVGPKNASTFVRDVVISYDIENRVHNADKLYLHPIDRWIRRFAALLIPEHCSGKVIDWVVAGKLSKFCRIAGVCGTKFNVGASYFGQQIVRQPDHFDASLSLID